MSDNINFPVLGIFRNDDKNISAQDVRDLDRALTRSNVKHDFHYYDGAGHGFQDFVNFRQYVTAQTAHSWIKFFDFMGRQMG